MSFVGDFFSSIGRIFSPPSPQIVMPAAPPAPPADPTPQVSEAEQRAVEAARERQRRAAAQRQNRSRTILTGAQGIQDGGTPVRRTKLGGG